MVSLLNERPYTSYAKPGLIAGSAAHKVFSTDEDF